jgi:hypothetical protein
MGNRGRDVWRDTRTLVVTPVQDGSGETITALHVADEITARGGIVGFLASPFARRFIEPRVPARVWPLGVKGGENRRQWDRALAELRPAVVLFADYPLMFFPNGCAPLARETGWVESLEAVDATLVTMDHFGFGQREHGFFLGPPHLGSHLYHRTPPLPGRMHVMLPCPMHEPGAVPGRLGVPFRYWDLPLSLPDGARGAARREYAPDGGKLVFHSVPGWALNGAAQLGLPFYEYLPELLDVYLGGLDAPVTVVSVNDGALLPVRSNASVRVTNLGPLPRREYEALLFGADLVITENKTSISMGKAVCALQPCAALTNRRRLMEIVARVSGRVRELVLAMERARLGSVYPYAAFPSMTPQDLDEIGLYRGNRLTEAFLEVEVFGGDATRETLRGLLFEPAERAALADRQRDYIEAVQALPNSVQVLAELIHLDRTGT